jgi:hypothetical protein
LRAGVFERAFAARERLTVLVRGLAARAGALRGFLPAAARAAAGTNSTIAAPLPYVGPYACTFAAA